MDVKCPNCGSHDVTVEPTYPHVFGFEAWPSRAAMRLAFCNDCGCDFNPDPEPDDGE